MSKWNQFTRKKNRKIEGCYLALPHTIMKSPNFIALSTKAIKLLLDIAVQYNGSNNGDLQATWVLMEKRGWKSRDTLNVALQELLHFGLIEKTRQGSLNKCNLFAVTWRSIDECGGKLDVTSTKIASNQWKAAQGKFHRKKNQRASTKIVITQHDDRANVLAMAA